tara:strand:+ start:455 stop:883 length:429 start_codon:yes stop_codon:yes gene_type:complete
MILDSLLKFSDAQALTATADSTNVIDLGLDRDIGIGEPMAVVITVGVSADVADADETYQFQLETDDNAAMSSSTVIGDVTVAGANLVAGDKVVIPIGHSNERYLQVLYTLGGTSPSVTVDAFLQPFSMIDGTVTYASGYSIT